MYFKIESGSEVYNKLKELQKKCNDVKKQLTALPLLVDEATGDVYSSGEYLAGDVVGIVCKKKPEGWKQTGEKHLNCYMPKVNKQNKEILDAIAAIPKVDAKELNSIVGFKAPQTPPSERGIVFVKTVNISFAKNYILMSVTKGCKYKPLPGIVEIVASEYEKLKPKEKK